MNIRSRLKSMNFRQLWSLFWLCAKRPFFVLPTIRATRETVRVCDTHFGKNHHKNGPSNAFRHALWNGLIIKKCQASGRSVERSAIWAETFTHWHEDFSPNKPLARAMDEYNNELGRTLAQEFEQENEDFLIGHLLGMVPLSRKRNTLEEIENSDGYFVYID